MTLPLQTFRVSASYPITVAGASATIAETLAAINSMLVTEAGLGGMWGVSNYNAGNGTLEIKRLGTQTGVLSTFRALLFGGFSPNAAALAYCTANSVTLYGGVCQDANSSGPTGTYTTGSPYQGLRWTGGAALAYAMTKTAAPHVWLIESDEMCCIAINDNTYSAFFLFGGCVERLSDGATIWCSFTTGGGSLQNLTFTQVSLGNGHLPLNLGNVTSYANYTYGGWHDGTYLRAISRLQTIQGDSITDPFAKLSDGWLAPINVADRVANLSVSATILGTMRQVRMGPKCINKCRIVNGTGSVEAYGVSCGVNVSSAGLYFDTQA